MLTMCMSSHRFFARMKGEFMDEVGQTVNYEALRKSPLFADYKKQTSDLLGVKLDALNRAEKMAFCISILPLKSHPHFYAGFLFCFVVLINSCINFSRRSK